MTNSDRGEVFDTMPEVCNTMSMTTGQELAATLRKSFRINTRTRDYRDGGQGIKAAMLESIANAVQYPGYYNERRTELSNAAWGTYLAYQKHVDGYRIDGGLRYRITSMSPWDFAGLLGRMVDAGVTCTGAGETFFNSMSHETVAA